MKVEQGKKFFDVETNVRNYIESCEGKDSRLLIETLKKHLIPNSTVLELGMGAGKDLDILSETYKVTGSDYSKVFLNLYKQTNPNADLLLLDAKTLETNRKFDCIYSNKVLHHLSRNELIQSLRKQKDLLNSNGILFHTFWRGETEEKFQDLKFIKYKVDELKETTRYKYNLLEVDRYEEMIPNDSIYIVLKPYI